MRLLIFFLVLFSVNAEADLNKWVDAQGKVHYSDEPPPENVKVESVHIPSDHALPTSAPSSAKSLADQEEQLNKEMKAKEKAAAEEKKKQADEQLKQKNCEIARTNLRVLQDSPRIATYDASGNRSYLDDTARNQKIEDARNTVNQYCN